MVLALYGADPDPQGALKAAIAEAPAAARAELPKDVKVKACGALGIDETKVSYWRVRQGFAWYFDLGAQDPDFDAGNVVIIARGADGAWKSKP